MVQQYKHLIVRANIGWCPLEKDLNKFSDWIRKLIRKNRYEIIIWYLLHLC